MKAGWLNRRVEILRNGRSTDGWGQPLAHSWLPHLRLWASIRNIGDAQDIKAGVPVRVSLRIRHRADIHAGMRAVHGRAVYEIVAVVPDEDGREHVDLVCKVLA
ncbi:MAG: phage head closure protein [Pseudomonas aeruginosa]